METISASGTESLAPRWTPLCCTSRRSARRLSRAWIRRPARTLEHHDGRGLAALLENMFDDRATVSESRADHYIEKERGGSHQRVSSLLTSVGVTAHLFALVFNRKRIHRKTPSGVLLVFRAPS
jgi:hypothetical protein